MQRFVARALTAIAVAILLGFAALAVVDLSRAPTYRAPSGRLLTPSSSPPEWPQP